MINIWLICSVCLISCTTACSLYSRLARCASKRSKKENWRELVPLTKKRPASPIQESQPKRVRSEDCSIIVSEEDEFSILTIEDNYS